MAMFKSGHQVRASHRVHPTPVRGGFHGNAGGTIVLYDKSATPRRQDGYIWTDGGHHTYTDLQLKCRYSRDTNDRAFQVRETFATKVCVRRLRVAYVVDDSISNFQLRQRDYCLRG